MRYTAPRAGKNTPQAYINNLIIKIIMKLHLPTALFAALLAYPMYANADLTTITETTLTKEYTGNAYGSVSGVSTSEDGAQVNKITHNVGDGAVIDELIGGISISQATGNSANLTSSTLRGGVTININGGSVGAIKGGNAIVDGDAQSLASQLPDKADVGFVKINVNGGVVGKEGVDGHVAIVGGGGQYCGIDTEKDPFNFSIGNIYTTISGGTIYGDVYGATDGGVVNTAETVINGGTINGDVYGGGKGGTVSKNVTMTLNGGTVNGNVYAAGNGDVIKGDVTLTIKDTKVTGGIYAGGVNSTVQSEKKLVLNTASNIDTLSGFSTITFQKDTTVEKIENAQNGTTLKVQANGTVKTDLKVKSLELNQYNGYDTLTVKGNLETSGGTLNVFNGNTVNVSGTTTLNAGTGSNNISGTLKTEKLVVNGITQGTTSISGTLKADEVEVNHTFSLSGSISALDSADALMTVNEGGKIVQQGCEIDLKTVVQGGTIETYRGNFADLTLESGVLDIKGNTGVESLTLNGGEIVYRGDYSIDLNGGALVIDEDVTFKFFVESLETVDETLELFSNVGENSTGLNGIEVMITDKTGNTQAYTTKISNGTVVATIPEPTTATMSLLALAALAARRRRR